MTYLLVSADPSGIARASWRWYCTANGALMHGSILILAKKKAAGPGGYFDPMAEGAPMAMGPMVFEMGAPEKEEEEGEDEGTDEEEMSAAVKPHLANMDFRSAANKLREIATQLEQSSSKHAGQAAELKAIADGKAEPEEPTEEVAAPKAEAPKAKKAPPAFLKKTVMKY